jgi:hypothetical protein
MNRGGITMHDLDRTQLETNVGAGEFGFGQELPGGTFGEGPFNEMEALELATELMSVQSEQELEQFLGSLIKKAGSAIGSVIRSPIGQAIGGTLKSVAKAALPTVGSALGSFIPIPGVGTAIGGALGSALSNALEMEGVQGEDHEFEMARKFVQVAGKAVQQAAAAPPSANPQAVAAKAIQSAIRQVAPAAAAAVAGGMGPFGAADGSAIAQQGTTAGYGTARSGRWFRRGRKIVLIGV